MPSKAKANKAAPQKFIAKSVVGKRTKKGDDIEYRVKWESNDGSDDYTWESEDNAECAKLIEAYNKSLRPSRKAQATALKRLSNIVKTETSPVKRPTRPKSLSFSKSTRPMFVSRLFADDSENDDGDSMDTKLDEMEKELRKSVQAMQASTKKPTNARQVKLNEDFDLPIKVPQLTDDSKDKFLAKAKAIKTKEVQNKVYRIEREKPHSIIDSQREGNEIKFVCCFNGDVEVTPFDVVIEHASQALLDYWIKNADLSKDYNLSSYINL